MKVQEIEEGWGQMTPPQKLEAVANGLRAFAAAVTAEIEEFRKALSVGTAPAAEAARSQIADRVAVLEKGFSEAAELHQHIDAAFGSQQEIIERLNVGLMGLQTDFGRLSSHVEAITASLSEEVRTSLHKRKKTVEVGASSPGEEVKAGG